MYVTAAPPLLFLGSDLALFIITIADFFRRASRNKNNFDRQEFMRNSVAIGDNDWNTSEKPVIGSKNALALARANSFNDAPSSTPRPPTMIERRQNMAGAGASGFQPGEVVNPGAYYQQDPNAYYNYGNNGYGYDANQQQYGHYTAPQEYAGAYTPPTEYQQSELTRKPSAPRAPGRGGQDAAPEEEHGNYVVDDQYYTSPTTEHAGRHDSVTPFQQQQYADIQRQLNTPATTAAGSNLGRSLSTTYASLDPKQPAKSYQDYNTANRSGTPTDANPQQTYYTPAHGGIQAPSHAAHRTSVYDDEDAYGGI